LLNLIAGEGFDGMLCGDDQITQRVIDAALPRLRVISKYGIGLDSIDVTHATAKRVPVLFTPGVNHTTVAEHTFGLMIALAKHFWPHIRSVKGGSWKRVTGSELAGKTIAVLGVGRIGREVIKRAIAFDMKPVGFDVYWDEGFARLCNLARCMSPEEALRDADIVTLHMNLDDHSRGFINTARINQMKRGAIIINTARGGLVVEQDVAEACRDGRLGGYAADVLEHEPVAHGHPFLEIDNIIVTPHVGSRTHESVQRQGLRAVTNLVNYLTGKDDYIQANK
jgi:D-3-phosphoglycerate dehydrogenase